MISAIFPCYANIKSFQIWKQSAHEADRPRRVKKRNFFLAACLFVLLTAPSLVHAQERDDDDAAETNEPPTQLEIGPEIEVPLHTDHPGFGGSVSLQLTPIPDWLEFEIGLGALASSGSGELEAEFLFEKPFEISPTTEFMIEAGPSLSRSTELDEAGTFLNIQAETGFFIWPSKSMGWYASVGWSDTPKNGAQSLSADAGILIPVF